MGCQALHVTMYMYFDVAMPQGWTKGTPTVIYLYPADLVPRRQSEMAGRLLAGTQTPGDVTYFCNILTTLDLRMADSGKDIWNSVRGPT